ncbi:hypothetical protein Hanom_Chr09g00816501 [Helianthus anomalus]
MGNEKSREEEELGLHENLHGNQTSNSGIQIRWWGPRRAIKRRERLAALCTQLSILERKRREGPN